MNRRDLDHETKPAGYHLQLHQHARQMELSRMEDKHRRRIAKMRAYGVPVK